MACVLCKVDTLPNRRYRLRQREEELTELGETLERIVRRRITSGVVCLCCKSKILKVERLRHELDVLERYLRDACTQFVSLEAQDSHPFDVFVTQPTPEHPVKRYLPAGTHTGVSPLSKRPAQCLNSQSQLNAHIQPPSCRIFQGPPRRELFPAVTSSQNNPSEEVTLDTDSLVHNLLSAPTPETPSQASHIPIRVASNTVGLDDLPEVEVSCSCIISINLLI